MQFATVTTLAFAALAAAQPVDNTANAQSQEVIYLWNEPNFKGSLFKGQAKVNECKPVLSDRIHRSSGKAAGENVSCTVWSQSDCKGDKVSFDSSGSPNFPRSISGSFFLSYKCVRDRS